MRLTVLAALGLCAALTAPASAVEADLGVSVQISLQGDGGACVSYSSPEADVGQFSAAGVVTAIVADGVMKIAPIAGVKPLVGPGSAGGCIPGVYGAHSISGTVVYEVTLDTLDGDYVEVLVCNYGGGTSCT